MFNTYADIAIFDHQFHLKLTKITFGFYGLELFILSYIFAEEFSCTRKNPFLY
jgi:hypothetical protein